MKKQGDKMLKEFNRMKNKYEIIGDVRGKGFMIGVELVKDKKSKERNGQAAANIMEKAKDLGLLLLKGGLAGNVIRIAPLYCTSPEDLKFMLEVFEECV